MISMGPPGSGKGTQAARISERLAVPAISTGDIFRQNITDQTPLGVESRKYIDVGDFVPDGLTNRMVRDRLGPSTPKRVPRGNLGVVEFGLWVSS